MTYGKIGILTSGGEAPGMNAIVQRIVEACSDNGIQVVGFEKSWKGFVESRFNELTKEIIGQIAEEPGTILGSCRGLIIPKSYMPALAKVFHWAYDMLIAIGGDGTTRQCQELSDAGLNVIVIPCTIDGMSGTYAIGLNSAIQYNADMARRLVYHATAMERILVYQVMGRDRDDIAIGVAKETGFPLILSMDDLENCLKKDRIGNVLIASEKLDVKQVVDYIEGKKINFRVQVAGYLQRVANVTKYDLDMSKTMAQASIQAYLRGESGSLVCYDNDKIEMRSLADVHY